MKFLQEVGSVLHFDLQITRLRLRLGVGDNFTVSCNRDAQNHVLHQQSYRVGLVGFFFFFISHTHSLASRETLKSCFWFVGGNLLISKDFSAAYRLNS